MANLADLVADLRDWSGVSVSDYSDNRLGAFIEGAVVQHNPRLTLATLPLSLEEAITTLAWVKLCLVQAAEAAKDPNLRGPTGYGSNRNQIYDSLIALSEKLYKRYQMLAQAAGSTDGAGSIVVGQLVVRDQRFDCLVPLLTNENIPAISLAVDNATDTTSNYFILHWEFPAYENLFTFAIIALIGNGTDPIYQVENYTSASGIPCINDAATIVSTTRIARLRAFKITGIDKTVQARFMVVVRSASDTYAYSNELLWTPSIGFASANVGDTIATALSSESTLFPSPTPPDVSANPSYANKVWLKTGAQPSMYFWNSNLSQWINVVDGQAYSP